MTDKYYDAKKIRLNSEEGASKKTEQLFKMWNDRLLRGSTAHFLTSQKYSTWENWLSVGNITLAISVLFLSASQKFVTEVKADGEGMDLANVGKGWFSAQMMSELLPYLSLLVVLTSAFQYISQYASKSSRHKQAAVEYANLRRKLERYWTKESLHPEAIHSLSRSYNLVAKFPPMVPDRIWQKAEKMKKGDIERMNDQFFGLSVFGVDFDEVEV